MGTRLLIPDARQYIPALDGLRAASVLIVLVSHFGLDRWVPGGFGVTVFFWISGYLITSQLALELGAKGRVDLGGFYVRRFLRLLPAAFFYILIAGSLYVLAGGTISTPAWLAAFFYGANYYHIYAGFPPIDDTVRSPLSHLWSLAVEEHFYLIWPVLIALLWRRRLAIPITVLICLAALVWRLFLYHQCVATDAPGPLALCGRHVELRLYMATDTRLDSIAWGALVALWHARSQASLTRLVSAWPVVLVAVLGLLLSFLWRSPEFREVWRYTVQGLALSVLIPLAISLRGIVASLLTHPAAVYIGRLSYSLYLWHWGAVILADWCRPGHPAVWLCIALAATIAGALISFYLVERPLLALRRRFGSQVQGLGSPAASQAGTRAPVPHAADPDAADPSVHPIDPSIRKSGFPHTRFNSRGTG